MNITRKTTPDPAASLHVADAYMRWQLLAAEEVVGKNSMTVVLRSAGLERLIDNYPPENFDFGSGIYRGDYAALSAALMNFFGRAGKAMTLRIGRVALRHGLQKQSGLFNVAALAALKVLPSAMQLRLGMENMQNGYRTLARQFGEEYTLAVEDRGEHWAYLAYDCPMCAGHQADVHICWIFTGALQEATTWMTGKQFDIQEVACRALGAPACVWEISKNPKE